MCGIALIISGVRIDLSSLLPQHNSPSPSVVDDGDHLLSLKEGLRRRGPDSLGEHKVLFASNATRSSASEGTASDSVFCQNGEFDEPKNCSSRPGAVAELHFIGATLQLRGTNPIVQPLVDSSGNVLIFNGEIFGGVPVGFSSNDAEILMQSLGKCCSSDLCGTICDCNKAGRSSVGDLLSLIKGPWALVYWQSRSKTLWFGRDAFGRRSLLVHWPTIEDSRLLLSSVSPHCSVAKNIEFVADNGIKNLNFWEELSCGIYSLEFTPPWSEECLAGKVRSHGWSSSSLKELTNWERTSIEPKPGQLQFPCIKLPGVMEASNSLQAQRVLFALRESVLRRSIQNTNFQEVACEVRPEAHNPVAVLFSGGLDSMILAALLDKCLDPYCWIDLLNVSFDGESAPDRISARVGIEELRKIAPSRRWKLVEIDAELSTLAVETKHVMSLITPAKTYMDLNIGVALWLAAGGDGWVSEDIGRKGTSSNICEDYRRERYKSESKILLVGSGADEQCAGYGRHRTKYRERGWAGLNEEMRLDMRRIWKRNLGRDDRCIADNGKEARFPFLDEDVIRTLLDIPLWDVADLEQPSGKGDKKILREVAQLLGLCNAAVMPKRAIQFGSRIARESNRRNFGSNRAANQASAGSALF